MEQREKWTGRNILQRVITAAGGAIWQYPESLYLKGQAHFTPFGQSGKALCLSTYEMHRVFPQENTAAHRANGKISFWATTKEADFLRLRYDGQQSNIYLSELAQPYSEYFKWSNNFGFGIIRFADRKGCQVEQLVDDQVEGHPCHTLKITDSDAHETFFWADQKTFFLRSVGFSTALGYHHRIYSKFESSQEGFIQPCRVRIYFDGLKWLDIEWQTYTVNQPIADIIFEKTES